jgi:hypothetical protein
MFIGLTYYPSTPSILRKRFKNTGQYWHFLRVISCVRGFRVTELRSVWTVWTCLRNLIFAGVPERLVWTVRPDQMRT